MNLDIGVARAMTGVEEGDGASSHLLIDLARREMCAFVLASMELFGLEIVSEAEDSWLDALNQIDFEMPPTPKVWRKVTIQAASQLAAQVVLRESGMPIVRLKQVLGRSNVVQPVRFPEIGTPGCAQRAYSSIREVPGTSHSIYTAHPKEIV